MIFSTVCCNWENLTDPCFVGAADSICCWRSQHAVAERWNAALHAPSFENPMLPSWTGIALQQFLVFKKFSCANCTHRML